MVLIMYLYKNSEMTIKSILQINVKTKNSIICIIVKSVTALTSLY